MRRLRWLVLATHVPPSGALGGMVRYTTELLMGLQRHDDVDVAAVTTPGSVNAIAAIVGRDRVATISPLPSPLLALRERRVALPSPWREVDVVHGVKHMLPKHGTALRVLTVHDLFPLDRPDDFHFTKRTLLPAAYRASIRDADLLVCVSAATDRRLAQHLPAAAGRSAVVPLAASGVLRQARAERIDQLTGRRFALVVGDASPRKNLRTLIEAWPAVAQQVPGATLAVVGPPNWGRSHAADASRAQRLGESMVALSHVSDAQLRWAYENAVVVLCPSLAEGFGLPVVEALDMAAPIIISDDPAMREAADGRAWRVLAADDPSAWETAVVDVFRQPPARPAADSIARTWDDVTRETVEAGRRALESRARRGLRTTHR